MQRSTRQPDLTCQEARLLISCTLVDDPALTDPQREAFAIHHMLCMSCASEYDDTRELLAIVRKHWGPLSHQTQALLATTQTTPHQASITPKPAMTIEQGWDDLKRRLPELDELQHRQPAPALRLQLLRRIAAAAALAACVALAFIVGRSTLTGRSTGPAGPRADRPDAPERFYAQIVTPSARQSVPLGQPLLTADQCQEILLGGIHRVVMNRHTQTTVTVNNHGPRPSYEIQLDKGELYVEVVPSHPFTVKTPNALLTITGTRFDVRTQPDQTDLVLVRGTVRFSHIDSPQATVVVAAGQASTVSRRSPPTSPQPVDALAASAWATNLALRNALARLLPDPDQDLSNLMQHADRPTGPPPTPDRLDYAAWRDENRPWFTRQFPWIFHIQNALLRDHGIDADYIDLLMISGDVWQFRYDSASPPLNQPIAVFDPAAVDRLARHFTLDPRSLLQAARPTQVQATTQLATPPPPALAYADALRRWHANVAATQLNRHRPADDLLLFSLRASVYLTHTRTAALLWANTHPQQYETLSNTDRHLADCLSLLARPHPTRPTSLQRLADQLAASQNANQAAQALLTTPASPSCASQSAILWQEFSKVIADLTPEPPAPAKTDKGEPRDPIDQRLPG